MSPRITLDPDTASKLGDFSTLVVAASPPHGIVSPSFGTVTTDVAMEDISQVLRDVPSTQPHHPLSQEPGELLGSFDPNSQVVLPTLRSQQAVPPRPWISSTVGPPFFACPGRDTRVLVPVRQPALVVEPTAPVAQTVMSSQPPVSQSSESASQEENPPLDTALSWVERVDWEEQEQMALATSPVTIPREDTQDGQGLLVTQPCPPMDPHFVRWT